MKKWMLVLMSITLFFALSAPLAVDAKGAVRGGSSYTSPKKSYTPTTPSKQNGSVSKTDPGSSASKNSGTANTTTPNRGFFSGGSFMRGMLVGGLAGMLFGGMFGGMGAFGNMLGFMVNVLALIVLISIIRKIVGFFMERRKFNQRRY